MKALTQLLTILITTFSSFAQEQYTLEIKYPSQSDIDEFDIKIDVGKGFFQPKLELTDRQATAKGIAYSSYYQISITHFNSDRQIFYAETGKKSRIEILPNSFEGLENAVSRAKAGGKLYDDIIGPLEDDLKIFFSKKSDLINSGDEVVKKELQNRIAEINRKRMDFIRENPDDFFSFLVFKNSLLRSKVDGEQLYQLFNQSFNGKIRQGTDAKSMEKYLLGKRIKAGEKIAPRTLTSFSKENIKLASSNNSQLFIFWASWCRFCIEEMPEIQELKKSFANTGLQMIGVSLDQNETAFETAVKKYNLNWPQIYGPEANSLATDLGFSALPSYLLVDKNAKILFKKEGVRENQIEELKSILEDGN